jgi:O-antigen/teichoic acid export membrane protein
VVQRVQLGYQEGFANGAWGAAGSLLGLVALFVAIAAEAPLPWLVAAMAGGPVVALAANGVVLFRVRRPWLRPRRDNVRADAGRALLKLGALFFVLQAVMAVAFLSDNIVAAQLFGASAVAQYNVPQRLFDIVLLGAGLMLAPLWPAYAEALARRDTTWVAHTLRRSLLRTAAIVSAAALLLVTAGPTLLAVWVGPVITPSRALLLGFAAWALLGACGTAVAMFLNGAHLLRFQVATACIMAAAAITLKIILGARFGLAGIIWGTVLGYTLGTALPMAWYVPRVLRQLRAESAVAGATKEAVAR